MLSYTGMVYVLSCRGFLDVMYTGMVYVRGFLVVRTQGWCMFSLVEAFLLLSYTDGVCSLL